MDGSLGRWSPKIKCLDFRPATMIPHHDGRKAEIRAAIRGKI
jgi:hypothetical protein